MSMGYAFDNVVIPEDGKEISIQHHGRKDQEWGKRNGPPYPLYRQKRFGGNGHNKEGTKGTYKETTEESSKEATPQQQQQKTKVTGDKSKSAKKMQQDISKYAKEINKDRKRQLKQLEKNRNARIKAERDAEREAKRQERRRKKLQRKKIKIMNDPKLAVKYKSKLTANEMEEAFRKFDYAKRIEDLNSGRNLGKAKNFVEKSRDILNSGIDFYNLAGSVYANVSGDTFDPIKKLGFSKKKSNDGGSHS